MDDMFLAVSCFRRRRFEECAAICSKLLEKNPYDQAAWVLKTKALTQQVYVDDCDVEEEGVAEVLLDDTAIAQMARPGTSLKTARTATPMGHLQSFRPFSNSGRPVSGVLHPGNQSSRPTTMEQAMKTPRTASHTARPVTSSSGRFIRLGTASMLTSPDGPFINVPRLNISKYASNPSLAKPLFEYLYYHENDVRTAMNLASEATQKALYKDWWWKLQIGKCCYRLGLLRDAEKQLLSALRHHQAVDIHLYLAKVYIRMDQPLTAMEVYNSALEKFPGETTLLIGIARLHEGLGDLTSSVSYYKNVLQNDATNVEAIACLATHHFYNDQPEVAMRFYRRLLQMGVCNSEVFTNLGLCCFYAQQFDLAIVCFERALALASDDVKADVWYNISHIALGIGDTQLAYHCLRLTLALDGSHAEAYNNLAIMEWRKGHFSQANAFFQSSFKLSPHLYEPFYNHALLAEQVGDLQTSCSSVTKAIETFPAHTSSKELLIWLRKRLSCL